ncbi:NADPH cytochrome P450 oxidoreductase family protein [Microbulbifer pacificus]|uniref:NADPH--hemoprotein reductase n=1 Tax=Microbulbifer pacificus TaxID=407164 RepID=A0AAU0MZ35_9GAMM|nr:NADPH cytochrome P450 oxidoreductase family protein [Microbulbifer pacificus]WOX05276.1 NADPH cytochrome P450 oxidoreductase family protein [Microbulbifer pacificus]
MTEGQRIAVAVVCALAWLLWVTLLIARHRRELIAVRRQQQAQPQGSVLIAYASQSGTAAALARQSAEHLRPSQPVTLLPLSLVTSQTLQAAHKALFVVSTYGEGEPPDNGQRFARNYLTGACGDAAALDLSHLSYSVVALGDSTYERFCAFGQRLFDGMAQLGAKALEPLYKVDSAREEVSGIGSGIASAMPAWFCGSQPAVKTRSNATTTWWRLAQRTLLNPGSPGAPLFELTLRAVSDLPKWRAGDVFVVQPRQQRAAVVRWLASHDLQATRWMVTGGRGQTLQAWLRDRALPDAGFDREKLMGGDLSEFPLLPVREYSVASGNEEKALKLIVRQQFSDEGRLGLGSGWLTEYCELGELFSGYLRENGNCHTPDHRRPLLLIGAGSGLAGLRAQLAERAAQANSGPVWLVFGERCPDTDRLLAREMDNWLRQGTLARCDRIFSRGERSEFRYVQEFLAAREQELRTFVSRDADIYVCGNRTGMGEGVHRVLKQLLGEQEVETLLESGRYRRDLY